MLRGSKICWRTIVWWDEGVAAVKGALKDPAFVYAGPADTDAYNAEIVAKYQGNERSGSAALFEQKRLEMIALVRGLPKARSKTRPSKNGSPRMWWSISTNTPFRKDDHGTHCLSCAWKQHGQPPCQFEECDFEPPPQMDVKKKSLVYETPPWGYTDQPAFLNQVVMVKTYMEPDALLSHLKRLETALGREPNFQNGPRLIDIDILFYDDVIHGFAAAGHSASAPASAGVCARAVE
jgi:hypothetical protein